MTLQEAIVKACQSVYTETTANFAEHVVDTVLKSFERSGYQLVNTVLSVDQRNAGADAFWSEKQSIQAVLDAIIREQK